MPPGGCIIVKRGARLIVDEMFRFLRNQLSHFSPAGLPPAFKLSTVTGGSF